MGTAVQVHRGKRVDTNGEAVFMLHFRTGRFRGVVKGLSPSRPAGVAEARGGAIRWGNILPDKIVELCPVLFHANAASPSCVFGLMKNATPRKDYWVGVHMLVV